MVSSDAHVGPLYILAFIHRQSAMYSERETEKKIVVICVLEQGHENLFAHYIQILENTME